ncbi:MAG: hypothetical protein FWG47_01405 [Propionibacteriaceae bacterium]|nr:hypothetical protein [Propionibacteriaceae bacterium]
MKRSTSLVLGVIGAAALIVGVVLAFVLVGNDDLNRSIGGLQIVLIVAGCACVGLIPVRKLLASDRKKRATCTHPDQYRAQIGVKTVQYGAGPKRTMPWYRCQRCGKTLN